MDLESFSNSETLLNLELFDTLLEAKISIERWRREYNQIRPQFPRLPTASSDAPLGATLDSTAAGYRK